ncbi:Vacuolar fusion protein MON1 homolog, partial [Linum perenne]
TQNSAGGNTTYLLRIWATTKVGKSPPPSRSSACENLLRIWVTTWSENLLRRRGRLLVRTSSGNDEVVCNAEVACNDDRDSEVLRGIGETKQLLKFADMPAREGVVVELAVRGGMATLVKMRYLRLEMMVMMLMAFSTLKVNGRLGNGMSMRYGDEHWLAGFSATLQAIISFVENGGDRVKYVRAGMHQLTSQNPLQMNRIAGARLLYETLDPRTGEVIVNVAGGDVEVSIELSLLLARPSTKNGSLFVNQHYEYL